MLTPDDIKRANRAVEDVRSIDATIKNLESIKERDQAQQIGESVERHIGSHSSIGYSSKAIGIMTIKTLVNACLHRRSEIVKSFSGVIDFPAAPVQKPQMDKVILEAQK